MNIAFPDCETIGNYLLLRESLVRFGFLAFEKRILAGLRPNEVKLGEGG